jgi:hypothetical protein
VADDHDGALGHPPNALNGPDHLTAARERGYLTSPHPPPHASSAESP